MEDSSSENLDDGELWLPSDIFPVEEQPVPCNNKFKNNNPITCSFCCCYSCLHHDHHDLIFMAEQKEKAAAGAAISLPQHQQAHNIHSVPKPFPITERRFRPAERCCSCTDCSLLKCFERNGGGRELLRTGPPPAYPYQSYPPPVQLQHQVESLMEARTRFLQVQEKKNRFFRMHNLGLDRFAGNRFLPFVGGGGGGGGGGFNGESSSVRDYGGTGVFLPRVPTNIDNNGGKRQGGRNRQDVWSELSTIHMTRKEKRNGKA